jgi:hypothetical protein
MGREGARMLFTSIFEESTFFVKKSPANDQSARKFLAPSGMANKSMIAGKHGIQLLLLPISCVNNDLAVLRS